MEKKRSSIQLYAIVVNVIAVITFLMAATAIITSLIDRSEPLLSGRNIDLSSFGKYKMDVMKSITIEAAYIPTDEELRKMYDAAKELKINQTLHWTFQEMMVSGFSLVISIILFAFHWPIMIKYNEVGFQQN